MPASVGRAQTWPAHGIAMSRKDPTFGFRESSNDSICVISGWGEAFVYTYLHYIYNLYMYILYGCIYFTVSYPKTTAVRLGMVEIGWNMTAGFEANGTG